MRATRALRLANGKGFATAARQHGIVGLAAITIATAACTAPPASQASASRVAQRVAANAMQLVQNSSTLPPHAARVFGYTMLAVQQAQASDQLTPAERHTVAALASAQVLAHLLPGEASQALAMGARLIDATPAPALQHTSSAIAAAVSARADADGYLATRFAPFSAPSGESAWVPTGAIKAATEPFWGTVQTFSPGVAQACGSQVAPPVTYATDPTSEMYQQALATYRDGNMANTDPTHDYIAYYWSDAPYRTTTPAGHWLQIAIAQADAYALDDADAASLLWQTSAAMHDAFVTGWKLKYDYFLLRPVTYIRRHIDEAWRPRLITPAFPEYVSGHAVASAAAATVLQSWFGDVAFVDDSRAGVVTYDSGEDPHLLAPRAFGSFWAAATEAATSRLYGGIHFPMGNAQGLVAGACAAQAWLR